MNVKLSSFIIILFGFFAACVPKTNEQESQPAEPLFDLKNYFETQAVGLKRTNPKVFKTVSVYGKSESKDVSIADWNAELKPFIETDISKPALKNSFKIDSPDVRCPDCYIVYTAVDSSQTIRKIELRRTNEEISQIVILKNSGGKLTKSTQTLTWMTGLGYSIVGRQDVALGKENDYSINVSFVK